MATGQVSLNPQACKNGTEQHSYFTLPKRIGKPAQKRCQYDYRHVDGELFSCVTPALADARAKRDNWLSKKEGGTSHD